MQTVVDNYLTLEHLIHDKGRRETVINEYYRVLEISVGKHEEDFSLNEMDFDNLAYFLLGVVSVYLSASSPLDENARNILITKAKLVQEYTMLKDLPTDITIYREAMAELLDLCISLFANEQINVLPDSERVVAILRIYRKAISPSNRRDIISELQVASDLALGTLIERTRISLFSNPELTFTTAGDIEVIAAAGFES